MKIGLVGNQNCGKTTLFNYLTGMNAKIGNWPGVTIEKKSGKLKGTDFEIIDLPGIYSLSPYSEEEEVSRKFIFDEKPDLIINVVDATSIERGLYLTTQLMELDCRLIVVLNMADILEEKGIKINKKQLEKNIGTEVIQISALRETGIVELIEIIKNNRGREQQYIYDAKIENSLIEIENLLNDNVIHKRFIAVKILEDDKRFIEYDTQKIIDIVKNIKKNYDTDLEEIIAEQRYDFSSRVKKECVEQEEIKESNSDKLDKIFLNKWLAFPIFAVIMFLVYYISVGFVGGYTVEGIEKIINLAGEWISQKMLLVGASEWLGSMVVDGIIAGVGAVLGFIPQLIILFFCISLLETTGYMSRIALLLDKMFRKIGLSGKSLIPFIIGSGCSVPGIMGTRIIENEDERKITTILTPFIPCSAKLPIIALFAGYFFPNSSGMVSVSLYFLAIIIIVVSAWIMKKYIFKNTSSTFISELPDYKKPSLKYVLKDVFDKVVSFIKRAGSFILISSIIIWFLLSFSTKMKYGVNIEESILATIGKGISWIFYPILGTNSWEAAVSAIQGLVAKEQVVSSMAVISGFTDKMSTGSEMFSQSGAFGYFTGISAYAFMIFNLFSAPCFGAIGAMKRELGGTKGMIKTVLFQTILAWILSTLFYQIGSRIDGKAFNIANIVIGGFILAIVLKIIISYIRKKDRGCSGCAYNKVCNKK